MEIRWKKEEEKIHNNVYNYFSCCFFDIWFYKINHIVPGWFGKGFDQMFIPYCLRVMFSWYLVLFIRSSASGHKYHEGIRKCTEKNTFLSMLIKVCSCFQWTVKEKQFKNSCFIDNIKWNTFCCFLIVFLNLQDHSRVILAGELVMQLILYLSLTNNSKIVYRKISCFFFMLTYERFLYFQCVKWCLNNEKKCVKDKLTHDWMYFCFSLSLFSLDWSVKINSVSWWYRSVF